MELLDSDLVSMTDDDSDSDDDDDDNNDNGTCAYTYSMSLCTLRVSWCGVTRKQAIECATSCRFALNRRDTWYNTATQMTRLLTKSPEEHLDLIE